MGPAGSLLGSGHAPRVLWGSLAAVATCFLLAFLVFLCSRCHREKKPRKHSGDHENLMNVPLDKEMLSQSVTSLDAPPSSEHNGALTNGDVLSEDSAGTCMPPYEEVQTSASDLLDSQDSAGKPKCPQSRELPRIPRDSVTDAPVAARSADGDAGPGTEGPYEVLKDSCSQEHIVEDCLYETVTEIKEVAAAAAPGRAPGGRPKPAAATSAAKEPAGSAAPRGADFAEYASVDRNKKCRQSAPAPSVSGALRDPEEDAPPPVPEKVLDENDNVPGRPAAEEGAPDATSKRLSSLSYKSREEDPTLTEEEISAMYSSVHKPGQSLKVPQSVCTPSPGAAQRSPSSCSDLYATVKDFEKAPHSVGAVGRPREGPEPDYEAIQALSRDGEEASGEPRGPQGPSPKENDYESIGDLQQGRDVTRL